LDTCPWSGPSTSRSARRRSWCLCQIADARHGGGVAGRPATPASRASLPRVGRGTFFDYTDIDDLDLYDTADLFQTVAGFAVDVRPTKTGPRRMPIGRRCINTLLDGVPARWNDVPSEPADIMAVEIYELPKDIPREYNKYTWGKEQCSLIVYWTVNFSRPMRGVKLP
jgi:hypothetical protein